MIIIDYYMHKSHDPSPAQYNLVALKLYRMLATVVYDTKHVV